MREICDLSRNKLEFISVTRPSYQTYSLIHVSLCVQCAISYLPIGTTINSSIVYLL